MAFSRKTSPKQMVSNFDDYIGISGLCHYASRTPGPRQDLVYLVFKTEEQAAAYLALHMSEKSGDKDERPAGVKQYAAKAKVASFYFEKQEAGETKQVRLPALVIPPDNWEVYAALIVKPLLMHPNLARDFGNLPALAQYIVDYKPGLGANKLGVACKLFSVVFFHSANYSQADNALDGGYPC